MNRLIRAAGGILAVALTLTTRAEAHVWRVYCNGVRQGYVTDTSADCWRAANNYNAIAAVCASKMTREERDRALRQTGDLPANGTLDCPPRPLPVGGCGCEPEAVRGEP